LARCRAKECRTGKTFDAKNSNLPKQKNNGIESVALDSTRQQHFVQVQVRSALDSTVPECAAYITRVEHRSADGAGFSEVIGEALPLSWSLQPSRTVVLSKGIVHRFNICAFYDEDAPGHQENKAPIKLQTFYNAIGRKGQYRYYIHVAGRDVTPIEGIVIITWRNGGLPLVDLETSLAGERPV
jgi:hypothetical protein